MTGHIEQVDAVAFEGLVFTFRVFVGYFFTAANFLDCLCNPFDIDGVDAENLLGVAFDIGQRHQNVFDAEEFITEFVGLVLRIKDDLAKRRIRHDHSAGLARWQAVQFAVSHLLDAVGVGADFFKDQRGQTLFIVQQGVENMQRRYDGMRAGHRQLLAGRHCFLGLDGEFIKFHLYPFSVFIFLL